MKSDNEGSMETAPATTLGVEDAKRLLEQETLRRVNEATEAIKRVLEEHRCAVVAEVTPELTADGGLRIRANVRVIPRE